MPAAAAGHNGGYVVFVAIDVVDGLCVHFNIKTCNHHKLFVAGVLLRWELNVG